MAFVTGEEGGGLALYPHPSLPEGVSGAAYNPLPLPTIDTL